MGKTAAKKNAKPNTMGFFATIKNDHQQASRFNKMAFWTGVAGFAAGILLFTVSVACKLGPIPALVGFALLLVGAVVAGLIAYRNHNEVNTTKTSLTGMAKSAYARMMA